MFELFVYDFTAAAERWRTYSQLRTGSTSNGQPSAEQVLNEPVNDED